MFDETTIAEINAAAARVWSAIRPLSDFKSERPSILCITKEGFEIDVEVVARSNTPYNWLFLPHSYLKGIQRPWMPPELMVQGEYARFKGPVYDEAWEKCRELAERILIALMDKANLVAVMTANFDYWEDEGTRLACDRLKIAYCVLLREHIVLPCDMDEASYYYKDCPVVAFGQGIAVAGKASLDVLEACKVYPADKVWITGFPRYDPYIRLLHDDAPRVRNSVILLSYQESGYMVGDHFFEVLDLFEATAELHQDIEFIVKFKTREYQADIEKRFSGRISHRLKFISEERLPALFPSALAVIGTNSIALLEALLVPTDVLVPFWGTAHVDPSRRLFDLGDSLVRKNVTFLESPDAMKHAISNAISDARRKYSMDERVALFQRYVAFSLDETASQRITKFVQHCIEAAASHPRSGSVTSP